MGTLCHTEALASQNTEGGSGREEDHAETLKDAGFARGVGAPIVFYNAATKVRMVVHRDPWCVWMGWLGWFGSVEVTIRYENLVGV